MAAPVCASEQTQYFPILGLLALATTLTVYIGLRGGLLQPTALVVGALLTGGGAIQLLAGIRSHQQGSHFAAATLLPLGIFWLSLISYYIFPALGLGRHPTNLTMFCYLSLWGFFMAILFLGSFRQFLIIQILYGAMMCSFMALAIDHLRTDQVFLFLGCLTGIFASLAAVIMAWALCRFRVTGQRGLLLATIIPEQESGRE
jgi:succinate-acetate transporter protein